MKSLEGMIDRLGPTAARRWRRHWLADMGPAQESSESALANAIEHGDFLRLVRDWSGSPDTTLELLNIWWDQIPSDQRLSCLREAWQRARRLPELAHALLRALPLFDDLEDARPASLSVSVTAPLVVFRGCAATSAAEAMSQCWTPSWARSRLAAEKTARLQCRQYRDAWPFLVQGQVAPHFVIACFDDDDGDIVVHPWHLTAIRCLVLDGANDDLAASKAS